MKTRLFFSIFSFLIVQSTFSQETTVNLSLGAGYANQVYYKLSTQTQTDFVANSWDIAFLGTGAFDIGLRVNDAIGIEVFEVASTPSEWSTIDVAHEASWTKLYIMILFGLMVLLCKVLQLMVGENTTQLHSTLMEP